MASVGFIGVGVMGCEMVRNLLKARHRVRVFDVRPEASEALRHDGAEVAASVADAVRDADIAITMLPDTPQVQQALFLEARAHGEGGNGNQALFRVYDRLTGQGEAR